MLAEDWPDLVWPVGLGAEPGRCVTVYDTPGTDPTVIWIAHLGGPPGLVPHPHPVAPGVPTGRNVSLNELVLIGTGLSDYELVGSEERLHVVRVPIWISFYKLDLRWLKSANYRCTARR